PLVDRLQLFLRRLQFLVGGLQLLVDGDHLLVAGFELFDRTRPGPRPGRRRTSRSGCARGHRRRRGRPDAPSRCRGPHRPAPHRRGWDERAGRFPRSAPACAYRAPEFPAACSRAWGPGIERKRVYVRWAVRAKATPSPCEFKEPLPALQCGWMVRYATEASAFDMTVVRADSISSPSCKISRRVVSINARVLVTRSRCSESIELAREGSSGPMNYNGCMGILVPWSRQKPPLSPRPREGHPATLAWRGPRCRDPAPWPGFPFSRE